MTSCSRAILWRMSRSTVTQVEVNAEGDLPNQRAGASVGWSNKAISLVRGMWVALRRQNDLRIIIGNVNVVRLGTSQARHHNNTAGAGAVSGGDMVRRLVEYWKNLISRRWSVHSARWSVNKVAGRPYFFHWSNIDNNLDDAHLATDALLFDL